jgi:hypothetical protein
MRIVKYTAIILGAFIVLVFVLIGVLSVTRTTPVTAVIAEGDKGGPPSVSDPLFPRTLELFTETHIEPGNNVQIPRERERNLSADLEGYRVGKADGDGSDVLLAAGRSSGLDGEIPEGASARSRSRAAIDGRIRITTTQGRMGR